MTLVGAAGAHSRTTHNHGARSMRSHSDPLAQIRAVNQAAAFNQWCGIEVTRAESGMVEIAMP